MFSEIGDLKVGEDEIKGVRKTKYLGLTIDEDLYIYIFYILKLFTQGTNSV